MEASQTKNCLSYFREITPLTRDHGVVRVKAYFGFAAATVASVNVPTVTCAASGST
jgi:hypothetical protein